MDKEFEKSKIYSAVNADELMAGDKVIVADNLADLRDKVMKNTEPDIIKDIRPDYNPCRFMVKGDIYYFGFAFLVERKENCTNCEGCVACIKPDKTFGCGNWKPKPEQKVFKPKASETCVHCEYCGIGGYCRKHNRPTPYDSSCPFYHTKSPQKDNTPELVSLGNGQYEEKAETSKYRPFNGTGELIKVWLDKGVKWQKRTLTMPLIWVREKKNPECTYLLNGYLGDRANSGYMFKNMQKLFDEFEFLDGTPCGVEVVE